MTMNTNETIPTPTNPALAPAVGSASELKSQIAALQRELRKKMNIERTARVATSRWGVAIYKLRSARGMSCSDLARACKTDCSIVSTMETVKQPNPTLDTMERLASAFGITASELVKAYEQEPEPNSKVSDGGGQ